MLFLFLFWWLFCWRSHNKSRCEIKIKQRVAQSKQKGKQMRKMGHHSSRKRLCSTQNRVTDVHDTLAVCYERASVSSYDSIRYKRTPMWLQNGAIYVLWLTPSKDKWSSIKLAHISLSVSQATGTMADSVRMSSHTRPIGAEKFRTIRFFFGQWPKGRP